MTEDMPNNYHTIASIRPEEESEFIDFLKSLILNDVFPSNYNIAEIVESVIKKGIKNMNKTQAKNISTGILRNYTRVLCPNCSYRIPWSEMFETVVEGGECRNCKRIFDHIDGHVGELCSE
jgi:DNA-directed RNA polymerase subunit RPC12/RpoP